MGSSVEGSEFGACGLRYQVSSLWCLGHLGPSMGVETAKIHTNVAQGSRLKVRDLERGEILVVFAVDVCSDAYQGPEGLQVFLPPAGV